MSERFLRLAEVQRRVPYSRSSIYLKIARGEFPPPINLGARAVAWLESDIDEWIASRVAKVRRGACSQFRNDLPMEEGTTRVGRA